MASQGWRVIELSTNERYDPTRTRSKWKWTGLRGALFSDAIDIFIWLRGGGGVSKIKNQPINGGKPKTADG